MPQPYAPWREEQAFGGSGSPSRRRFAAFYTHPDEVPPDVTRVMICAFEGERLTEEDVIETLARWAAEQRAEGVTFKDDPA